MSDLMHCTLIKFYPPTHSILHTDHPTHPTPHHTTPQRPQISLGEQLGQGAFGSTLKGRWRGTEVAVKRVRVSTASELGNFVREVDALSRLRHPHVVRVPLGLGGHRGSGWQTAEGVSGVADCGVSCCG